MKRYGKILSVVAAAAMLLSLAACGQSGENPSNGEQSNVPQSSPAESIIESEAPQSSPAESTVQSEMPQSVPSESAPVSETPQTSPSDSSVESEASQISPAECGTDSNPESSITEISSYGLESFNHPDYVVGKWSLLLDTSDLSEEKLEDAKQRMIDTSMVLNADGTAVGLYKESRIKGYWGEQGGYIYVSLGGDDPEAFGYYIDTLVSITYQGMSFVK